MMLFGACPRRADFMIPSDEQSDPMTSRLILIPLLTLMIAASAVSAWAQDKGTVNPKPLPPLANPNDPNTRRQGTVRPQGAAGGDADARARLLCPWLHRRRGRAADQRRQLAGDAAVTQPQLGPSRSGGAGQAPGGEGAQGCGLARHTGRRHVAAARRADAYRPRQPSGRTGRRHLADADAEPAIVAQRARGNVRRDDGARRPARHRSARLDADASGGDPRRCAGAERAAHLRQCRDQESAVPRSQGRSLLAAQGAADVRPRLSLPHPHQVPARQRRMREPARADRGRRLQRRRSRLLVQRRGAAPEAAQGAAETEAADDDGAAATRLQGGAGSAPDAKH